MKKWIGVLSIAWVSFALASGPVVYDVTKLINDPFGKVKMLGGKTITLDQRWSATKIFFEDQVPEANWGHPAAFKMVDANGKVVQEIKTTRPPMGLTVDLVVAGVPARTSDIKFALDDFGGKYKVKNPENFYAILINGRADLRHWNDFSFLYRTLVSIYGYKKENILVVDSSFKEASPDLDGDGKSDIDYASTKDGVKKALGVLAGKLTDKDQLLLAVNDHGDTDGKQSTIVLYEEEMPVSEFSPLLQAVKAGKVLTMYEQCFSGGFVRPSVSEKRVSMAAATDKEFSWASMDLNFDEWIYYAISAFAMQTHDGKKVNADTNGDGKISAQEAFAYSVAQDKRPESPLLESAVNAGDSAQIGLGNFGN